MRVGNQITWVANDKKKKKKKHFIIIFIWLFNKCTQTSYYILYHTIRMPTHVCLRFNSPTPHSQPRCSGSICPGVMPRSACLARTSHKRARLCLRNPTWTDTKNIVECECFFLHQLINIYIHCYSISHPVFHEKKKIISGYTLLKINQQVKNHCGRDPSLSFHDTL